MACWWLRMRRDVWREWTEGWNVKKEIIIGGMFTFTGTEEFNDLTPIALCPDAIEATVRLANLRRVLVISPTVESASFLWQKHYKFFFRTIPSAYTASFIFSRLFQEWQWKRVAIFRKDDHYFYREGFMAYNVTLVDDFEVKESMLTYAVAQKNVMTIKQRNVRIIIVDHSAAATAKILCAAFHLNMLAEKGYVWFLSPWIDKTAWDSPEIIPPECSVYDLKLMHKFSFSLSQAVAYSAPSIGYNRSLENFEGDSLRLAIFIKIDGFEMGNLD
ncbi:unnamed protein product [Hymenolepis diminuta]|uniref:Receptor ligand binding region domain-containing protein n=1 Tax=Hymenolepis diminuta TaxID=6216 RepID=A0A3P7A692_HYMDI|nr:unnamed protein product [Hymenolepis diminuta]